MPTNIDLELRKDISTVSAAYQSLRTALANQVGSCDKVSIDPQTETHSIEVFLQKIPGTGETRWLASFCPEPELVAYVGLCQTRKVPWLALGVEETDSSDFLRVNQTTIRIPEVLRLLEEMSDETSIATKLINLGIIRDEMKRLRELGGLSNEPIQLEDLQAEADLWRREHQLLTEQQTLQWLEARGFGEDYIEIVATERIVNRLALEAIAGNRGESFLADHPEYFDRICVERVTAAAPQSAEKLRTLQEASARDWYSLCTQLCAETNGAITFQLNQWWGYQLQEVLGTDFEAVRNSWLAAPQSPQTMTDSQGNIIRIVAWKSGQPDSQTRNEAQRLALETWLQEKRQTVTVTWLQK